MALDRFAVAAPGQARCRQPDARGLKDLALLGMRLAVKIGGTAEEAKADMAAFEGPVLHVTEPLVRPAAPCSWETSVDHALVQNVVRELISSAAARRPGVVYCADGVTDTGLIVAALRIALRHPREEIEAERSYFEDLLEGSFTSRQLEDRLPRLAAQGDYLRELLRVS